MCGTDNWFLDMSETIADGSTVLKCVCPFDEESIAQLEICVGGIDIQKEFLVNDTCPFNCEYRSFIMGKLKDADDVHNNIKVVFKSVSIN